MSSHNPDTDHRSRHDRGREAQPDDRQDVVDAAEDVEQLEDSDRQSGDDTGINPSRQQEQRPDETDPSSAA
jgi:hypothetical protein